MAQRTDYTVAVQVKGKISTATRGTTSPLRHYPYAIVGTLTDGRRQEKITEAQSWLDNRLAALAECEAGCTPEAKAELERLQSLQVEGSVRASWADDYVADDTWAAVCGELGIATHVYATDGITLLRNSGEYNTLTYTGDNPWCNLPGHQECVRRAELAVAEAKALVTGDQIVDGWAGRLDLAEKRVSAKRFAGGRTWEYVASVQSNGAAELREAKAEVITARQIADGELVASEITTEQLAQALEVLAAE